MKSKSSYLLAGAVALAVAGWMLSDDLFGKADGTASQDSASAVTTSTTFGLARHSLAKALSKTRYQFVIF